MESFTDHWNTSFANGNFSNEDAEFMANLLGNSSFSNESSSSFSSPFWATDDSITPTYPNDLKHQMYPSSYSQDHSYTTDESYYLSENTNHSSSFSFVSMTNNNSFNFCFGENKTKEDCTIKAQEEAQEVGFPLHGKHMEIANQSELPLPQISNNVHNFSFVDNSNKRPRTFSDQVDVPSQKKRNVKPKKSPTKQSSKTSSCGCSEGDDDYTDAKSAMSSQSLSESNGKGKGSRGSAGDPQSLYARKRREKINERLRILQSLVPNGTKVDISTMLEEAVQYVKFLQIQIKLLSSDDMWMYAPIAYNGMSLGIDMTTPTPAPNTTSS